MRNFRRLVLCWTASALSLLVGGCGAAYYGGVAGFLLTQEDEKKIRTTAPDAALASVRAPAFAVLTVDSTAGPDGYPLDEVSFPAGYGESLSDRQAARGTAASDRLFLQINGDDPQEITLNASTSGAAVAADIQAKVRALTPVNAQVPTEAYSAFTCTFDEVLEQYVLRSGVPGATSAVVVNPSAAFTAGANVSELPAGITAAALRLGVKEHGEELTGAQAVSFTIFNHGNDVLGAGTSVDLYLSLDKQLDEQLDLRFRTVATDTAVEVGRARTFYASSASPPKTIVAVGVDGRVLVEPGRYYLIARVAADSQAAEKTSDDNVLVSARPLQLVAPFSGFPVPGVPPATTVPAPLDLVPVSFQAPIAAVTSRETVFELAVQNFGGAAGADVPMIVDTVLGPDESFVEPTFLSDPAGAVAGFVVNPIDFARDASLILQVAAGATTVSVSGSIVTVTVDPASTVASLAAAVNGSAGANALVRLLWDENGDATADTVTNLLSATGSTSPVTLSSGGRLLDRRQLTFLATTSQQDVQTYTLDVALPPETTFATLPRKFGVAVRITPRLGLPEPEISENNMRLAPNYTRIYAESTALFDNGILLPTSRAEDFARLDAVTQRPVNTGSIIQGQQRVFRFEIPDTGVSLNESQLLVVVRTSTFDPHLELLDATGRSVGRSDDSALGASPLLYLPLLANRGQRVFYAIVSSARFDDSDVSGGGASFDLVISVNSRQASDPSLPKAVAREEFFRAADEAVVLDPAAGQDRNRKLIPFDLSQSKAEVMFVLPGRARVKFRSSPAFSVGVNTIITRFIDGEVPTPVQFQAEIDPATLQIVYRPSNGTIETSHVLRKGVYTLSFNSLEGPDSRTFLLSVNAEFIPEEVN